MDTAPGLAEDWCCGKVGGCDSSPNRHARAHAAEEGHSIEPGEDWNWCFLDEVIFVLRPV